MTHDDMDEPGCNRCDLQPENLGDVCSCGKRLRTAPNALGMQFRINQKVGFLNKTDATTEGIIRSIPRGRPDHALVRYITPPWNRDKYNETHPVSRIAESTVALAENMPTRRSRGQAVPRYEPAAAPPPKGRAKKQAESSSSKPVAKKKLPLSSASKSKAKATLISAPTTKKNSAANGSAATACAPPRRVVPAVRLPQSNSSNMQPVVPPCGDLWITDIILQQSWEPGSEHDTCRFNPSLRAATPNISICKFGNVEDLMCRVRFVECCAVKKHRGVSRLDRCQQRALLHRIYESATSSLPDGQPRFPRRAFESSGDVPKGAQHQLRWNSELGRVDCSKLTIQLVEKVLWSAPTCQSEFFDIPGTLTLLESPIPEILFKLVDRFLKDRRITPPVSFQEALRRNTSPPDAMIIRSEAEYIVPFHCPLCPKDSQSGREEQVVMQQVFNAMKPSLPLTCEQFRYAMNIVYQLFNGREAVERFHGISGIKNGKESGQRTMFGSINENLIEEIIQRSGLNALDTFTDIGSGIGQVCIQASATTCCRSFGQEVDEQRFNASQNILACFEGVLQQAGIKESMKDLVTIECKDFVDDEYVTKRSDVIVFNNYARWFESDNPGKKLDYNQAFGNKCLDLPNGGQVFVLRELCSAKSWFPVERFDAPVHPCSTWKVSEDTGDMSIFHYRKLGDEWPCARCGVFTPNITDAFCLNGHPTTRLRNSNAHSKRSSDNLENRCGSAMSNSSTCSGESNAQSNKRMRVIELMDTEEEEEIKRAVADIEDVYATSKLDSSSSSVAFAPINIGPSSCSQPASTVRPTAVSCEPSQNSEHDNTIRDSVAVANVPASETAEILRDHDTEDDDATIDEEATVRDQDSPTLSAVLDEVPSADRPVAEEDDDTVVDEDQAPNKNDRNADDRTDAVVRSHKVAVLKDASVTDDSEGPIVEDVSERVMWANNCSEAAKSCVVDDIISPPISVKSSCDAPGIVNASERWVGDTGATATTVMGTHGAIGSSIEVGGSCDQQKVDTPADNEVNDIHTLSTTPVTESVIDSCVEECILDIAFEDLEGLARCQPETEVPVCGGGDSIQLFCSKDGLTTIAPESDRICGSVENSPSVEPVPEELGSDPVAMIDSDVAKDVVLLGCVDGPGTSVIECAVDSGVGVVSVEVAMVTPEYLSQPDSSGPILISDSDSSVILST